MPIANDLPEVLETIEPERLATGFIFTEGPLWHPDGYWYFVDLRRNQLLRLAPGKEPELVRTTIGGNGTTFDLQGRLIVCEGDDRRLTAWVRTARSSRWSTTTEAGASTGRTT
jgi:gluconolactonase